METTIARPTTNGRRRTAGAFTYTILDEDAAASELSDLRSGKGNRTSKYDALQKACLAISPGEALATELAKNEVGGFRGHLRRHHDDRFDVRSAKQGDGSYAVYVFVNPES